MKSSSLLGSHLEIRMPGEDGRIHWMTGSGFLQDNAIDLSSVQNLQEWNYWTFQVDLKREVSRVFQNGNLLQENSGSNVIFGGNVDSFSIGTGHSQDFWKGSLDELRISTTIFSADYVLNSFKSQGPNRPNYLNFGDVNGPPVIFRGQTGGGFKNVNFSMFVQTFPQASEFTASGLPAGLQINASTGEISGEPKDQGTYLITVQAYNDFGSESGTTEIIISDPDDFSQKVLFNCEGFSGSAT